MFTPVNKHVMSTYVPSAAVSDYPEDGHYILCLSTLAGTLIVVTMIPQLCTGSCVNKFQYTTKGRTYARRNKTN